ncbi:probable alpha,alpha-trehalose-phosphate synthase [UDP-forming] 9 isoform X2 [Lathyrus oleraceus]|uniref:probable alpha,alpha-trehalose-phosphate synthase [UDP-forming] 9 isoform X2 n=1 Tax=Pisum sativum TaxID=3888 RepID=UPI0021D3A68B|nr:probable alpha,alpha-trehalose-phosphate synthase [UDP-forming] 9 isoform X2 [Pisum sativum]
MLKRMTFLVNVDENEQEAISLHLLEEFNCLPTFIPSELHKKFYDGFCKNYLWPLFNYMVPKYQCSCNHFDWSLWQAYVSANRMFADKVMEVLNPTEDYVWVHDYHLMVLPSFLRRRFSRVRLGFFLHSPFPSSEIFINIPVRTEILKAVLNVDMIGFNTFDYARHFLSICILLLGLEYESKSDHFEIEYFGRKIFIKILPTGIHMGCIQSALNHPSTSIKVREICKQLKGKKLIISVDDLDIFKGVDLKFAAFEQLLKLCPELLGQLVLVQILNPSRSDCRYVEEAKKISHMLAKWINRRFGFLGYTPVIIIDRYVPFHEKAAYYALAECCFVNAVQDDMNLVPLKYIACRHGSSKIDQALDIASDYPRTSSIVVSELIGCPPSLSGAIRTTPWDINVVAEALKFAITMSNGEKQCRHEKNYQYVSTRDVANWAQQFEQDLVFSCKDHYMKLYWGFGFGLEFRVLALSASFKKLSRDYVVSAYKRTKCRAIFLAYDGTIIPEGSSFESPGPHVISMLNNLCKDPNNTVFIVSGQGRPSLRKLINQCGNLGIAAEHGCYIRWGGESYWKMNHVGTTYAWKSITESVMRSYTDATEGSYMEIRYSALEWNYHDAETDFGSQQGREMLELLGSELANEPVDVKKGKHIVEVKLQGISKGLVVDEVHSILTMSGKALDFVLCIGDDRSDEDMFESISNKSYASTSSSSPEIFTCTVEQKPSKARYYLDDTVEVMTLLQGLAAAAAARESTTISSTGTSS